MDRNDKARAEGLGMHRLHSVIHFFRRLWISNESVGVTAFAQALHMLLPSCVRMNLHSPAMNCARQHKSLQTFLIKRQETSTPMLLLLPAYRPIIIGHVRESSCHDRLSRTRDTNRRVCHRILSGYNRQAIPGPDPQILAHQPRQCQPPDHSSHRTLLCLETEGHANNWRPQYLPCPPSAWKNTY